MRYSSQISADCHSIDAPAAVAAHDTELWRLDAVTLAAMIRNGQISSREAVQSSLDRLAVVNPALNAVVVTWVLCTAFRSL
jgi:hypothetical protein